MQAYIYYFGLPESKNAYYLNLSKEENSESNASIRAHAYLTKINQGRKLKFGFLQETEVQTNRQSFRMISNKELKEGFFKEGLLNELQIEKGRIADKQYLIN